MHEIPAMPPVADAPASLFDGGHLWIQEYVDGAPLRVQLQASGLLEFGTRTTAFDGEVPLDYRHAARHVREQFDRDPLRAALDDVTSVTFFGVATHGEGLGYDRGSVPPFSLVDVWSADDGLQPPDAVDALAERLGLDALPAVQKEVRAADFDLDDYEFPSSRWRDGPAASVLVRNKTGDRAFAVNDGVDRRDGPPEESPAGLAAELVTDGRVERALDSFDEAVPDPAVVTDRVVELAAHEAHDRLLGARVAIDVDAFRSEAGALVRRRLDGR